MHATASYCCKRRCILTFCSFDPETHKTVTPTTINFTFKTDNNSNIYTYKKEKKVIYN